MYKTLNWGIPTHIKNKISIDDDFKIYTKPARLFITGNTYRWKTVQYWNKLPDFIITEKKIESF